MKGRFIRILGDKNFGFIRGEDNREYFFHMDALMNGEFNQRLTELECEFEPFQGPKGPRAEQVYIA